MFRCRVSDHHLCRAPARHRARRPGGARSREAVGEGVGRVVRHRGGVGYGAQLRDGPAVAGSDGQVRRRARPAVRVRGAVVLRRGDLPRHLPVRLGPSAATAAPGHADPDGRLRRGRHVLRGLGQRVDEHSRRFRHPSTARSPTSTRGAAMFNGGVWLQFLHMWLAAFMVVGFVVSGVYAVGILRGRTRRPSPPRLHRAVRVRDGGRARAASRGPCPGHAHSRHPAGQAGRVRTRRDDRGSRAVPVGRGADRRRGARSTGDPAAGLDHRPQLVRRAGARPGHRAEGGLATGQHHTSGLPVDGGHRHHARRGGRHVLAVSLARPRSAEEPMVPAVLCHRGSAGDPRGRTRLGRHRGRPPAVDGVADPADQRRREHESRAVVELHRRAHRLCRHDGRSVVVLRSMARRWRAGEADLPSPYGPPREEPAS